LGAHAIGIRDASVNWRAVDNVNLGGLRWWRTIGE
jgi:hypothetical protein